MLRFAEADALYRFKQGFRSLADIRHPNLVSFYELLAEDGQWLVTMELVDGVDLITALAEPGDPRVKLAAPRSPTEPTASAVYFDGAGEAEGSSRRVGSGEERRSSLPEVRPRDPAHYARIRNIFGQLASGLHHLHCRGKLHRDIKPSNVLITANDRVMLLDFGLVGELRRSNPAEQGPQAMVGTPAYMSPEQAKGLTGTPACDWYSVGIMLFQTLAGELPFQGSLVTVMDRKQEGAPSWLRAAAPDLPADLEALCSGLLEPDPEHRLEGEEVLRRLGLDPASTVEEETGAVPFVGRQGALAELFDAYQASRGGLVTVFVRGESGMGKSALLARFVDELERRREDVIVLAGRCYLQESVPYKAIDHLIDALSRYLMNLPQDTVHDLLPADVHALARLFPVLRRVRAISHREVGGEEPEDPQVLRRRAFAALRQLFSHLASDRPLILIADDLQWGDVDSFYLLDDLLRTPDPPPMLIVGAYRREDQTTSPFLRALIESRRRGRLDDRDLRWVEVGKLSTEQALELTAQLGRHGLELPETRRHAVVAEAGGNPLFLTELTRHCRDHPSIHGEVHLHEVMRTRIAALPELAQRLLEVVAVAGKPIDLEVARQAIELDSAGTEALAALRSEKLVREHTAGERHEIEAFHDRIREIVVSALSAEQLAAHHRRLAVALESTGKADPETLAAHFRATDDLDRARDYAITAAERAAAALAFEHAVRLYRLALDLEPPQREERYRVQVQLGAALANAGRSRDAAETFLRAVGDSGTVDPIEAQRHAAEQLLISGHTDRGLAILRHVLRTVDMRLEQQPWKTLLRLWWLRLRLRLRGFTFDERDESGSDPEVLRRIDICWSAVVGLCLVDVLNASEFHARHLLLALDAGEPQRIARGLAMEVYFGAMEGVDRGGALELARELAGRVEGMYAASLTELATGMQACSKGAWNDGRLSLLRAEEYLRESRTGVAWELDTVQHFRVMALLHLGRWRELFDELPSLLAAAAERRDLYLELHLRQWVETLRLLVDDRADPAAAALARLRTRESELGFHFQHFGQLYAETQVALYSGRGRAAWSRLTARWKELTGSMLQRIEMVFVQTHDLRGRCAVAAAAAETVGRPRRLQTASRAAVRLAGAGSTWALAQSSLLEAGIASVRRDGEEAVRRLRVAEAAFTASDMTVHAVVARHRLRQLGVGGESSDAASWQRQGVRRPERIADMLAPGSWSTDAS